MLGQKEILTWYRTLNKPSWQPPAFLFGAHRTTYLKCFIGSKYIEMCTQTACRCRVRAIRAVLLQKPLQLTCSDLRSGMTVAHVHHAACQVAPGLEPHCTHVESCGCTMQGRCGRQSTLCAACAPGWCGRTAALRSSAPRSPSMASTCSSTWLGIPRSSSSMPCKSPSGMPLVSDCLKGWLVSQHPHDPTQM